MIDRLICEIWKSFENGNYLIALMAALSLPDICGKAEYPNEKQKVRYPHWYDQWVGQYETYEGSEMPYPTGAIVYELRNSLVHEGTPKIHEGEYKLTKFTLVNDRPWMCGGSSMVCDNGENDKERELEINISNLIWKLCQCAKCYYEGNKDKFDFLKNVQIKF